MKPSTLETTCSVTVDLIPLDMFLPDDAGGGVHAVPQLGIQPRSSAPAHVSAILVCSSFCPRRSRGMGEVAMRFQVLGLMFASALLMMAADEPKDAVKKEYDKFEGKWKMESFTVNGKP